MRTVSVTGGALKISDKHLLLVASYGGGANRTDAGDQSRGGAAARLWQRRPASGRARERRADVIGGR